MTQAQKEALKTLAGAPRYISATLTCTMMIQCTAHIITGRMKFATTPIWLGGS